MEIINIGSELLLGRTINTHQQWLCERLSSHGYVVKRQTTIADTAGEIAQFVRESLHRRGIVITTGGLGPTSDDLTRETVARMLDLPLQEDSRVRERLENFFAQRNMAPPPATRVQAQVPEGATVFLNEFGTAPGLALEIPPEKFGESQGGPARLILLPGPPRELHPMFENQVIPFLQKHCPVEEAYAGRTVRVCGLGESNVQARIAGPLRELIANGLDLGYCAKPGEVDVRLSIRGPQAGERIVEAEEIVKSRLGEFIFAVGDERLEEVVIRLLTEKKKTLATAESCTGGHLANRLTNVSGASAVFLAGLTTYSNEAKIRFLGVLPETLNEHGAVSRPTAREMAAGVKTRTGADFAISTTGIAGPTGGAPDKPVGTVFVGLAGPDGAEVHSFLHPFDRETFKYVTAQRAMDLLRRKLLAP